MGKGKFSITLSAKTMEMLNALCEETGANRAAVISFTIAKYYKDEKIRERAEANAATERLVRKLPVAKAKKSAGKP